MKQIYHTFSISVLVSVVFLVSCGSKDEKVKINPPNNFIIADSIPQFELFAKPLKDTSKETMRYELKVLNHSSKSRKILFYHCDINYGIRSTGGMIVPQSFHCNANVPYFVALPAHGEMKYHVKMDRPTVRSPKFYWSLVEVKQVGLKEDFTVLDTIDLETR